MSENILRKSGRATDCAKKNDRVSFKIDGEYYSFWSSSIEVEFGDHLTFAYATNEVKGVVYNNVDSGTLVISKKAEYEAANPEDKLEAPKMVASAAVVDSKPNFMEDKLKFDDLVKMAQDKFGNKLNFYTEMLEHDFEKKYAIFKAVIAVKGDNISEQQSITAHGDANYDNVSSQLIKVHYVRMAETRAIARGLRFLMNTKVVDEEKN